MKPFSATYVPIYDSRVNRFKVIVLAFVNGKDGVRAVFLNPATNLLYTASIDNLIDCHLDDAEYKTTQA